MAWVRRHRRRVPGRWYTTTVRSHYRRSPRAIPIVPIVIVIVIVVLVLIAIA